MRYTLFMLVLALASCTAPGLAVSGCDGSHPPDESPRPSVEPMRTEVAKAATGIRQANDHIATQAQAGQKQAPQLPFWTPILQDTSTIGVLTAQIERQGNQLDTTQRQIDQLQAQLAEAQRKAKDLEARAAAADTRFWGLFKVVGGAALVAGVVLFAVRPKLAPVVLLAGAAAIGVGEYMEHWAWLTGVLLALIVAGVVAYLGYLAWQQRGHIVELVRSGEAMKGLLGDAFATVAAPVLNLVQSPATKAVVDKVQATLGDAAMPAVTPPTPATSPAA